MIVRKSSIFPAAQGEVFIRLQRLELANALPRVAFLELTPEHMTGKLVNES